MDITKNSMLRRDHYPQPQPQPQPQQLRIEELLSIINIINMAPPDRSIRGIFRRDYKHMHNPPLNSYLIDDSIDDSSTNNPPIDADADADADANDDDTIDTNSVAEPAIDPAITNTHSQDSELDDSSQSLDLFDSVSQTLSARYTRRARQSGRSWVYEFFEVQLLNGTFYIPKGATIVKPERRYRCKTCTWSVLESKKDGTSNLINHLHKQHHITKHSTRKATQSVIDLLYLTSRRQTSCCFQGGLAAAFCSRLAKISRCSNARVPDSQGGTTLADLQEHLEKTTAFLFSFVSCLVAARKLGYLCALPRERL